jgi:hypothetical protein
MKGQIDTDKKFKLVRSGDGLTNYGDSLMWISWNKSGGFKAKHDEPVIGASLVLDFMYGTYRWMTTPVVSFEETKECLIFTTENSEYKLYRQ